MIDIDFTYLKDFSKNWKSRSEDYREMEWVFLVYLSYMSEYFNDKYHQVACSINLQYEDHGVFTDLKQHMKLEDPSIFQIFKVAQSRVRREFIHNDREYPHIFYFEHDRNVISIEMNKFDKIVINFIKRGFNVIGAGAYSIVLSKKDVDYVIKVNRHYDGWDHFVNWTSVNKDPRHPVIFKLRWIGTNYVAKIEKLSAITDDEFWDEYHKLRDYTLRICQDLSAGIDLHKGNVMKRGKQLVLTDPCVAESRIRSMSRF